MGSGRKPHFGIDISTSLLKQIVANQVAQRFSCGFSYEETDDKTKQIVQRFLTNLAVTDAIALRGDESTAWIHPRFSMNAIPATITPMFNTSTGAVTLPRAVARTFLLITLNLRTFSFDELRVEKTILASDFIATFGLQGNPLLFEIVAMPSPNAPGNVLLQFTFKGLFTAGAESMPAALAGLSSSINQINIEVPLSQALSFLPSSSKIVNAAIATESWSKDKNDSEAPRGIRIAFDVDFPNLVRSASEVQEQILGYAEFYDDPGIAIDDQNLHWCVAPSDRFFLDLLQDKVAAAGGADPVALQWSSASVSFSGPNVAISIPTNTEKGNFPAGEADLYITATYLDELVPFDPDTGTPTPGMPQRLQTLSLRMCASFGQTLDSEIFDALVGWWIGSTNPLGPLAGVLATVIAAVIIGATTIPDYGDSTIKGKLGGLSLPTCGEIDGGGCRTCLTTFHTKLFGDDLIITNIVGSSSAREIQIAGETEPSPSFVLAAPQALDTLKLSGWMFPVRICDGPTIDPVRFVSIRNAGGRPLTVCQVDQDVTAAQPAILKFFGAPMIGRIRLPLIAVGTTPLPRRGLRSPCSSVARGGSH